MRSRGEHIAVERGGFTLSRIEWPPRWDGRGSKSPADPPAYPPKGWPSKAQLDYTQQAIVVGLLVLALPWLVVKLASDPGVVLAGLGRRQTG